VLHQIGRYPDTAMSVVIAAPQPCTAGADRFDGAKLLGPVDAAVMARVDAALRAVQDL
jgi:mRNA interferase MazF